MDDNASQQIPLYASNVGVQNWLPEPSKDPTPQLAVLRTYLPSDSHGGSDLDDLVKLLHSLLEQTWFLLYGSDGLDEHDTISDSSSSINELVECFEDISTYIDCLMDLSLAIENPVLDPEPTDPNLPASQSPETFDVSPHALAFCRKIRDRFPEVDRWLVERLGEANARRASALTEMRERREALTHLNAMISEKADWSVGGQEESCIQSESLFSNSQPRATETTRSTIPPGSIFDTSNPDYPRGPPSPRNPIRHAVRRPSGTLSIVSFASFSTKASAITEGRPRVPPLPEEALEGKTFSCLACCQEIHGGITRKNWNCTSDTKLYNSTLDWIDHEARHRPQGWQSSQCPFCDKKFPSVSLSSYYKHVANHLREISLTALPVPQSPESDAEDFDSVDEALSNNLEPDMDGASPSDPSENNEVESSLLFKDVHLIHDNGAGVHMAWEQSRWTDVASDFPAIHTWANLSISPRWKGRLINVMSVADEIRNSCTQSALDGKSYLPLDHLVDILSPDIVWQLLSDNFDRQQATLLKFEVLGDHASLVKTGSAPPRRRRIFAILILIQAIQRLQDFVMAGLDDKALPLMFEPKADPCLRDNTGHELPERFSLWPSTTTKDFCFYQDNVQSFNEYLRQSRADKILGTVKKELHSGHILHPQLAYKRGNDYFLLFPLATGNLLKFFEKRQANPSNSDDVLWFVYQCWVIVRCVRKIHHLDALTKNNGKVSGRCGKITLESILWFEDYEGQRDYLAMMDVTFIQPHPYPLESSEEQFTRTCRPPDLDLDEKMTPKYDMLALGCVLLELITWFLLGYKEFINFSNQRAEGDPGEMYKEDKFFTFLKPETLDNAPQKRTAVVKKEVLEWINKLHAAEYCNATLDALLDLIQHNMLVPDSHSRWSSELVDDNLRDLYHQELHSSTGNEVGRELDGRRISQLDVSEPLSNLTDRVKDKTNTDGSSAGLIPVDQSAAVNPQLLQAGRQTPRFRSGREYGNKAEVGLERDFGLY
ncbi:serine threonine kinase [Fusarium albosuccineum]|uniref:Serine threonine kinase n=1 Tax=Fusarium albosuccineum TaxID=1237068 RepID=A0A8H4KZ19_9HYPO|nr:serine threonine kinase [Fusarium albosuccineum]